MSTDVAHAFRELKATDQQRLRESGYANLPLEFTLDEEMTAHGGATLVSNYYVASGLKDLLARNVGLIYQGWRYSKEQLLHQTVQLFSCGLGCIDRVEEMREDPVFRQARGATHDSCAQNLRYFVRRLAGNHGAEDLQDALLDYGCRRVPASDHLRFVMDLSTQRSWGHQEGVKAGRLGDGRTRPCCSWIVAGEATTQQVLSADFYPGSANGRPRLKTHLDRLRRGARQITGREEVDITVRQDGGFFSWANVDELKSDPRTIYLMPMDIQPETLAKIQALAYEPSALETLAAGEHRALTWTEKHKKIHYEYAEFIYRSQSRREGERVVVRRRPQPDEDGQPNLFWNPKYEYSVMVTNHPGTPEQAWLEYDQGGIVEQIIENGKQACGWSWFDTGEFEANRVSFLLKVLSSDLLRGFQREVLDPSHRRWQLDTLIRRVIRIPAQLVRRGQGWVLKTFRGHASAHSLEQAQVAILQLALAGSG